MGRVGRTSGMFTAFIILFACTAGRVAAYDTSAPQRAPDRLTLGPSPFILRGAMVLGPTGATIADVEVRGGHIVATGTLSGGARVVDVTGLWLAPAFIDSHVHLAYLPEGSALADHGIAGAVDMAAPEEFLKTSHASLQVLASGPMVTAVGGYPTQSWGRNGYGLECVDADAAVAAVDRLASEGARLIKLPVTGDPQLDDDALAAAVAEAHRLGVKVATHALTDEDAARAAIAGVDVLAHTPTEALSEATVSAWSTRTVVTTLVAFGNTPTTRANLSALRAAGTRVLYGTDFGNAQEAAINAQEVQGMLDAGMSGEAILNAGTYDAARFWGFTTLGAIEVGGAASLLVLDADPRADPLTLTRPVGVYMDGRSLSGGG